MENDQHRVPRTDDTAELPWARVTTPAAGQAHVQPPGQVQPQGSVQPQAPAGAPPSGTAPAVAPPVWSGRKTAIAAALAIGFASVGAIGAAAALPAGSSQDGTGGRGFPGGGQPQPGGQLPQGQPGQQNQQLGPQDGTQQFGGPGGSGRPGQVPAVPGDDDDGGDDDASTT